MISGINTALSGLNAATTRLNVSAQNIANEFSTATDTNGAITNSPYVPQQVVQTPQANGGVTATTQPVNPPSVSVYDPGSGAANANGITQLPNVDPAQQLVQAQIASYDFQGNLSVLKAENHNLQQILNIIS